jgi:nitrite reductase/ring-hydroxylating ferredoxin subunit
MRKKALIIFFSVVLLSGSSCDDNSPYDGECYIPDIGVNQVINLNLPEYFHLQNIGEFTFLKGGNRGIFLIHNYDDIFYALERTCPYKSDNECSQVLVDSNILRLRCGTQVDTGFVECCASKFLFDGRVVEGPSKCNLKFYQVTFQGSNLFINN